MNEIDYSQFDMAESCMSTTELARSGVVGFDLGAFRERTMRSQEQYGLPTTPCIFSKKDAEEEEANLTQTGWNLLVVSLRSAFSSLTGSPKM